MEERSEEDERILRNHGISMLQESCGSQAWSPSELWSKSCLLYSVLFLTL